MEADCDTVATGLALQLQPVRLWHMTQSIHEFVAELGKQMQHRHMFSYWRIDHGKFASRVLFQRPAHYVPEATLVQHVQEKDFPDRRVRKTVPRQDMAEFQNKCDDLRRGAVDQEQTHPVSFAIHNSWVDALKSDKAHYIEYTSRSLT